MFVLWNYVLCMYACLYYVCMYVCMYYVSLCVSLYVCMYVCIFAFKSVEMSVQMCHDLVSEPLSIHSSDHAEPNFVHLPLVLIKGTSLVTRAFIDWYQVGSRAPSPFPLLNTLLLLLSF
jgi:hypothetical protein